MRNTRPIHRRLAALAAVASAATAVLVLPAASSPVSAAGESDAAIGWIEAELTANDGVFEFPSFPAADWGLTIDAILALAAAGRADQPAATASMAALEAGLGEYIDDTFTDPENVGTYAGQAGKAMLAVAVTSGEVHDFAGRDLEDLVRSTIRTEGIHAGRFSNIPREGDFSNLFGQALTIMALSYTDDGVPTAAVDFLLAQQCPNGGFRLDVGDPSQVGTTAGCEDDADVDPDATGLALSALTSVPPTTAISSAIDDAVEWLGSVQDATTYGWAGTGTTNFVNANTTAIVVRGLRAVGETSLSALGTQFLISQQLTAAEVAGTPAAAEAGAVAYTPAAQTEALANGIADGDRDQYRRTTTQAALALGLPEFGAAFAVPVNVEPARLIDTRQSSTLAAGATLELQVAGTGNVPVQAEAAVLNVTAVGTAPGFVTMHPCLATPPLASSVNVLAGEVRANAVISAVDNRGKVCITNGPSPLDLVVDVSGYFPAGTGFGQLTPARLLDTRPGESTIDGQQIGAGPVAAGSTLRLAIAGRGGVADDAAAAVLNVTAIGATGPGFVTVHPCVTTPPVASNVNFTGPGVRANAVISALDSDGDVCLTVGGSSVNVIVDVNGYFPASSGFGALTPARLIDTRAGQTTVDGAQVGAGTQAGGTTIVLPVAGRGNVPAGATAAVLNVTVVGSTATDGSFVTVHPCLATPPAASNVNLVGAGVASNATVAQLTEAGTTCLTIGGNAVDVIVDVNGYFG